jgi:DNA-binding MarR family transcriptional regulator
LEKDGLINITEEQEKRRRFVEITKQGRAFYKKALPLWKEPQSQYKNQLGEQDMKNLERPTRTYLRLNQWLDLQKLTGDAHN